MVVTGAQEVGDVVHPVTDAAPVLCGAAPRRVRLSAPLIEKCPQFGEHDVGEGPRIVLESGRRGHVAPDGQPLPGDLIAQQVGRHDAACAARDGGGEETLQPPVLVQQDREVSQQHRLVAQEGVALAGGPEVQPVGVTQQALAALGGRLRRQRREEVREGVLGPVLRPGEHARESRAVAAHVVDHRHVPGEDGRAGPRLGAARRGPGDRRPEQADADRARQAARREAGEGRAGDDGSAFFPADDASGFHRRPDRPRVVGRAGIHTGDSLERERQLPVQQGDARVDRRRVGIGDRRVDLVGPPTLIGPVDHPRQRPPGCCRVVVHHGVVQINQTGHGPLLGWPYPMTVPPGGVVGHRAVCPLC